MTLQTALDKLIHIHAAFPFLEGPAHTFPRSFRVHIAAMLNQYCAAFFPPGINRMAVAFSANTPRSGKSLLAKMGIIAVHGWPQAQTLPMNDRKVDETELRKIIDSVVATGTPYLFFDNVRGHIESQALEAFLTVPVWTGRVFGSNTKTFRAENNCTLIVTGNDLNLGSDLRNRFLLCDLFVAEAEASERKIATPIEDKWIYDNRLELIECLQTLVENWNSKGRPGAIGNVRPGFETWCHTIGGIIAAAGMGDLLASPTIEASGSVEEQHAKNLAHALAESLTAEEPEREYKTSDLANLCYRFGWFNWQIDGKEEVVSTKTPDGEVISETVTIKLSPKARSAFGYTVKKYAPEHMGRTWKLAPGKIVRLQSKGEDHTRRIIATLEFTDLGLIHQLMRESGITLEQIQPYLVNFSTTDLDAMPPHELRHLAANFYLIRGQIEARV